MNLTTKRASMVAAAVLAALGGSAFAAPLVNVEILVSTSAAGPYTASLTGLPTNTTQIFYEVAYVANTGAANTAPANQGSTDAVGSTGPRSLDATQGKGTGVIGLAFDLLGNATDPVQLSFTDPSVDTRDTLIGPWALGTGASPGLPYPRTGASTLNDLSFIRPIRNGLTSTGLHPNIFTTLTPIFQGVVNVNATSGGSATISGKYDLGQPAATDPVYSGFGFNGKPTDVTGSIVGTFGGATKALTNDQASEAAPGADKIFNFVSATLSFGAVTVTGGLVLTPPTAPSSADGQNVTLTLGNIMPGSPLLASIANTATSPVTGNYSVSQVGTSVVSAPGNPVAAGATGLVQVGYGSLTAINTTLTIQDGVSADDKVTFVAQVAGPQDGEVDSTPIPQGGSYAGLHTTGGSAAGNTAWILQGTGVSADVHNPNTIVKMSWANSPAGATFSTAVASGQPGFPSNPNVHFISRILTLSGMDTDTFVLQLSYDPSMFPNGAAEELLAAQAGWIKPVTLDPSSGNWVPAWATDHGVNQGTFHLGAFDPNNSADSLLGAWGVDPTNHDVWAVVDHNSQFGVVPEPGTLSILGLSALGLCARRRRHA